MPLFSRFSGRSKTTSSTPDTFKSSSGKGWRLKRRNRSNRSPSFSPTTSSGSGDAPWRAENLLKQAPSEENWWEEVEVADESDEEQIVGANTSMADTLSCTSSSDTATTTVRRFHNPGYDVWEKARAEWRKPVGDMAERRRRSASSSPVRKEQIVRGITSPAREFDLPSRIALKDMIAVYTDIWENH